jgi:hypothetical protein
MFWKLVAQTLCSLHQYLPNTRDTQQEGSAHSRERVGAFLAPVICCLLGCVLGEGSLSFVTLTSPLICLDRVYARILLQSLSSSVCSCVLVGRWG